MDSVLRVHNNRQARLVLTSSIIKQNIHISLMEIRCKLEYHSVWMMYDKHNYVFRHFSAAFCTAHCALDLARDHVP